MIGFNEGIKMGLSDDKVIGTILGDVYGITLGIDVGTDMGYLDGSFDGSNYGKIEEILLVDSLISTNVKVIGSNDDIKLRLFVGKVL